MHRLGILILGALIVSGCAKVDKLLTLQSLSANQDAQRADVKKQNKQFDFLLQVLKDNRLSEYPDQKSFVKAFGEPILTKKITQDGKLLDQWLYRYSEKIMGSEKVYLYFDEGGKFVNFRRVAPAKKTNDKKEESSTEDAKT